MRRGQKDTVHRITDAPEAQAAEQARRVRTYLVQMGIRVVCIFAAVLIPGPARWVLIVAAVLLPYTAVLFANAGPDRREQRNEHLMTPREIGGAPPTEHKPHARETDE